VGGSAQEWQTSIDAGLVAGSAIELRLVMTVFGGDDVNIAYEVAIRTG
jgi:hypothetical protein